MPSGFFWTIFCGYFLAWALFFIHFESEKEALYVFGRRLLFLTLAFHALLIPLVCVIGHADRAWLWQLTAPLIIIGISIYMEWRYRAKYLLLFSLPIVLLFSILLGAKLGPELGFAVQSRSWLWFHFGFILAGLAGFVTSVSSAVMYLVQSAQLKSRHPGLSFLKLPSLDTLDKIHFRSLVWGVLLFSIGIAAGVVWAKDLHTLGALFQDPKAILSLVTCAMYWVIVSIRFSSLRRGQKIAMGTLVVFILLFLTIASSYVLPGSYHKDF